MQVQEEACGLQNFRHFSRARKTTLLLCLALMASIAAVHLAKANHAAALAARLGLAEEFVFIGAIVAYAWTIRRADEFIRRTHMAAAALAFVAAAVLLPIFDILQRIGVYRAGLNGIEDVIYLPWAAIMIFYWWRFAR